MGKLVDALFQDIRIIEGLKACISCGTCTAICPAAQFYHYDPRQIAETVQNRNEQEIEALLKSDTIWMCGECLSCKTRCPRDNTPAYIIQSLRSLSVDTGLFAESKMGRQLLAVKRTVGEHILKYGYCIYLDDASTELYPEQGPVWDWYRENVDKLGNKLGINHNKPGGGAMRKISEKTMNELRAIFDETGGTERFEKIEKYSEEAARKLNLKFEGGKDEYFKQVYEK